MSVHRSGAPIHRLPFELLEEIFILACLDEPVPLAPYIVRSTQFYLSHVCRRWRAVALNIPSLWSDIEFITEDLDPPGRWPPRVPLAMRMMEHLLPRCKGSTIQFSFEEYHESDCWEELPEKTAFDDRIRTLSIDVCAYRISHIPVLNNWLRSPALEVLDLTVSHFCACMMSGLSERLVPVELSMPSSHLKSITITDHVFMDSICADLSGLEELSLTLETLHFGRVPTLSILDLLRRTPLLQSLLVKGDRYIEAYFLPDDLDSARAPPVQLPELRELTVKCELSRLWWIYSLHMPSLQELDIDADPDSAMRLPIDWLPVLPPLVHLTRLILPHFWRRLIPLLADVAPNLKVLVTGEDWFPRFQGGEITVEAERRARDNLPPLLPALEELHLAVYPIELSDDQDRDPVEVAEDNSFVPSTELANRIARRVISEAPTITPNLRMVSIFVNRGVVAFDVHNPVIALGRYDRS